MDFITKMPKDLVIATLRQNMAEHKAIYEEAVNEYFKRVLADLELKRDLILKRKFIEHAIRLPIPEEHTDDYQTVINMLEQHIEDTVELSQNDYQTYMLNNWSWQRAFFSNTASYTQPKGVH